MKTFLFLFLFCLSSAFSQQKYIETSNMIQFHDSSYVLYKFNPTEPYNNLYFQVPNSLVKNGSDVVLRCVGKKDSLNAKATWLSYIKKEFTNSNIPFYLCAENDNEMENGYIKVILKTEEKDYTMFVKLEARKN